MSALPVCLICTLDEGLRRRMGGLLSACATLRDTRDLAETITALQSMSPTLLVFDTRRDDFRDWLTALCGTDAGTPVLVLAAPRSEPALAAERLGVFAVESPEVERRALQGHLLRAQRHAALLRENRLLKRRLFSLQSAASNGSERLAPPPDVPPGLLALPLARSSREIGGDVPAVLRHLVEETAELTRASRVGVFIREAGVPGGYRLREGLRCLSGTEDVIYPEDSSLALWMRQHAHFVARSTLEHLGQVGDQVMLEQSLDLLGAEVLIPLHRADGLMGWLFLGRRISGMAYSTADIESFMTLAEHVGASLEMAMLHEALGLQKMLLETVLQQVPAGIVAVDAEGCVRSLNAVAAAILETEPQAAQHAPVGQVSGRLADLFARRMAGEGGDEPEIWTEPRIRKKLSVSARRLFQSGRCMGAVGIVQDFSVVERMREQQERADRAVFWAELAAAIAHEVRNPLVAIKTFVQLLPERYEDPAFRTEFSELANAEIERVSRLVDQIHSFANPPPLEMHSVSLTSVLDAAQTHVREVFPDSPVRIESRQERGLPDLPVDPKALMACFAHILTNAFEALAGRADACVSVASQRVDPPGSGGLLRVLISDNGPGVPSELLEKVFSPFCTSKPRGIGLGLPIAKRVLLDHGGGIAIDSGPKGCTVTVDLPVHAE